MEIYVCADHSFRSSTHPRRYMKSTHDVEYLHQLDDDEYLAFKEREAKFYLWDLDVSDPMYEKWLKEGCHPKYHNWKKLPWNATIKLRPERAHPKHPLHAPKDVTLWVLETPTRLIKAWYREKKYKWPCECKECT